MRPSVLINNFVNTAKAEARALGEEMPDDLAKRHIFNCMKAAIEKLAQDWDQR